MSAADKKNMVPEALADLLNPKGLQSHGFNPDGTYATFGLTGRRMVAGQPQIHGDPETTAVEEAIVKVRRAEKHLKRASEQVPIAKEALSVELENYAALVRSIERFQETGEVDERLLPELNREVRRVLKKDQRDAAKQLEKSLPTAIYMAIRSADFRLKKVWADENFEYVTVMRKRKSALKETAVREWIRNMLTGRIKTSWSGPENERAARALTAARANIEMFWPGPDKAAPVLDGVIDVRKAMIESTGELVIVDGDMTSESVAGTRMPE